ncbi:MAG: hypothetical protein FD171_933 [Actinobacteria bacterium]|nr:MAG: hypothetical protein FD171_933 [Actinomycetota bacterium]
MKKTFIVVALAVALALSFAGVAMARPNGNIYIEWSATGANAAVPTPHAGYTTGTSKCAVCHSVHYAATSAFTWPDTAGTGANAWTSGSEPTEMLLRSSVGNACNYCHIQTAVGGVQLYGGIAANYTVSNSFAHNSSSASCAGCHAVHGAGTFQGGNVTKILRVRADRPIQPEVIGAAGGNAAITAVFAGQAAAVSSANKYLQQVAFCSQCHAEYTDASESTITGGPGYYDGSGYIAGSEYKGHPMKLAEVGGFSAAGDSISVQAAWVDSDTCRKCHDAGGVDQTGVTFDSFPHYTNGYYRFQKSGAYATASAVASSTSATAVDGLCLKCHINSAQDAGINITY